MELGELVVSLGELPTYQSAFSCLMKGGTQGLSTCKEGSFSRSE